MQIEVCFSECTINKWKFYDGKYNAKSVTLKFYSLNGQECGKKHFTESKYKY